MRRINSAYVVRAVVAAMFTAGTGGRAAKQSGTCSHRTGFLSVFAALALLLTAACGDDDTDGTSDTTETTEAAADDPTAFCDAAIELDFLGSQEPETEEGEPPPPEYVEQIEPALQSYRDEAPEEIAQPVTLLADELAAYLETGNFEFFQSEEFIAPDREVDMYMIDNCDVEQIELTVDQTVNEYAFDGVPESVAAGTIAITLNDKGAEMHEAILFRLNDDVTETVEQLLQLPEEQAMTKVTDLGGVIVTPGVSDTFFRDLEPARYGLVCFMPVGVSSPEQLETAQGEPHFIHGMFAEFEVTS
jgi:hypothetical protein